MIQSNTHETAAAIVLNGYCSGYFCCPDDAIWFKFTPTTTQYYTIYSTGYTDVKAQLYNSSLVYITQGDAEGPGDNFEITTELTANQTYYIKVTTFNSEGSFNIYVTADVRVEAVIIDPEFITLNNGSSTNLTATVLPTYATNQDLYWQSGNTNIATVDSNGRVTAVGGGETTICAYSQDGSNKYGCCRVVVPVYATDMKLQTSGNIAYMTQPFSITPIFTPYNTTNKAVTWCSSDTSIAEMGSNGKLITHKPGNVKITAISHDGSFSDSVDIRVVYDKITIMKDGNYNKVVFEYGNKEWLCLSKDIIYTETDPYYDEDVVRGHKNFHIRYQWKQYAEGVKEYTNEELRLLYGIDPYGVAHYIKKYSEDIIEGTISHKLAYKDQMFEVLFGRPPKYFLRTENGEWLETDDKDDLLNNVSESESYFGMYHDQDIVRILVSGIDLICGVLEFIIPDIYWQDDFIVAVGAILKFGILLENERYMEAEKQLKYILYHYTPGVNMNIPNYNPINELCENIFKNLSICSSLYELIESLKSKPLYYADIIDYSVAETNYDVKLALDDGTICDLYDVNEVFREYRYNQQ